MVDKLLIEKQKWQKDMDKLVELQVENQILILENRELQVENRNLKYEKNYAEKQLEDKEKKFKELTLHCSQLQWTVLNLTKNEVEPLNKLKKSDVAQELENPEPNEKETVVFQAEQFNFSYPIVTIPAGENEENEEIENRLKDIPRKEKELLMNLKPLELIVKKQLTVDILPV